MTKLIKRRVENNIICLEHLPNQVFWRALFRSPGGECWDFLWVVGVFG